MADQTEKSALQDEIFLEALAWAKGLARARGETGLTPRSLADGFIRIQGIPSLDLPPEIRARIGALPGAGEVGADTAGRRVRPVRGKSFLLSEDLRGIVARRADSVGELLDALADFLARKDPGAVPLLGPILAIASRVAALRAEEMVSAEVLAAAAYLACLEGQLDEDASLASYLVANRDACEALLAATVPKGFVAAKIGQPPLPLAREVQALLSGEGEPAERLRSAINAGLATGVRLATERDVAYHEAGHAVASAVLRPSLVVSRITIVPDAKAESSGATWYDAGSAFWRRGQTRETFLIELCVALSGRAAEIIQRGGAHVSAGASSDIAKATAMAWTCIAELGLDEEMGPISLAAIRKEADMASGWVFDLAQRRVHQLLREAASRAEDILKANWPAVERVVETLLAHKTIDDNRFLASLVRKSLAGVAGAIRARSRPVRRDIVFAQAPGVIETAEGPVRHGAGDAIVTGARGERWPVSRAYLERGYTPAGGQHMGSDGPYEKTPRTILAVRLTERGRVDMAGQVGILTGGAGDWIVDYGAGDLALVGAQTFEQLYEIL